MESLITGEGIAVYGLLALRGALRLESKGLKHRGRSALSIVRAKYGVQSRTAKGALAEFEAMLAKAGIIGGAK